MIILAIWVNTPLYWSLPSHTAVNCVRQRKAGPTSKTFCWLGSKMKLKVSFHLGLMSLSMCLVLFLLSGAVGMNSSTYGSGVSTAHTLQDYCYYEMISFGGYFFNANTQPRARNTLNMLASHENRFPTEKKKCIKTHRGHPVLLWWRSQLGWPSPWICGKTAVPPVTQHSLGLVLLRHVMWENSGVYNDNGD